MNSTPTREATRPFVDENGDHETGETLKNELVTTPPRDISRRFLDENGDHYNGETLVNVVREGHEALMDPRLKKIFRIVTPSTVESDSTSNGSASSPTYHIVGHGLNLGERYVCRPSVEKKRKVDGMWLWEKFESQVANWFDDLGRVVSEIDYNLRWMHDVTTEELLPDTKTFLDLLNEFSQRWTHDNVYDFFEEYWPEEMNINFYVQLLKKQDMMKGVKEEMIKKVADFLMSVGAIQDRITRCVSWSLKPIVLLKENGKEFVQYDFIPTFYFKPLARDTRAFTGTEGVAEYVGHPKLANAVVCGYLEQYYDAYKKCLKDGIGTLSEDASQLNYNASKLGADLRECIRKVRWADKDVSWLTIYGKMKRMWPISYDMAVLVEDLIWNEGNFLPIKFKTIIGKDGGVLYWLDGGKFDVE